MVGRLLCVGDIHGRATALKQVFARANVQPDDTVVVLGDVCDGGEETKDAIDFLLSYNTILIAGNHDDWAVQWMEHGDFPEWKLWWHQGGLWTAKSYNHQIKNVPKAHLAYLKSAQPYYEIDKYLFVHGGFDPDRPIQHQSRQVLTWDRELIERAQAQTIRGYEHVFIGHTTTQLIEDGCTEPLTFHNLTMLDTGAGWTGVLTLMDVRTKEFWQSDTQTPKR